MINIDLYKKRKKELGLTFEDLFKISGVPIQTLHNVFRGATQTPRIDTIQAIEKALGLNSAQSYINDGLKPESTAKSLSEKETRLLDAFNGLIPPMQDYILDMVEKLVAQPQNANKRA